MATREPTPLRPDIALVDRTGCMVCNTCGVEDGTVRALSFHWYDGQKLGGGSAVSLCRSCRGRTLALLAAEYGTS